MGLGRSELTAVGIIAASVLVVAAGLGFGAGAEPEPAAAPPTTSRVPLPEENGTPTTERPEPGDDTDVGTGEVTEATRVMITGIGALTLGLTLEGVEELTGLDFEEEGDAGCTTAAPTSGLPGLEVLLVDGEVATVSFTAGAYRTLSGIGIGATEQTVLSTYAGQIEQAADTLTFVPNDPEDADLRIVFRTEESRVTSFSAGRLPEVEEGCP